MSQVGESSKTIWCCQITLFLFYPTGRFWLQPTNLPEKKKLYKGVLRLLWDELSLNLCCSYFIPHHCIKQFWSPYGLQLWSVAAKSNIDIIQRFQSKILRMFSHAPWYVRNYPIHSDLNINTVLEEIRKSSANYLLRLQRHPNPLARALLNAETDISRINRMH